jgi:hypothetical protein
MTTNEKTYKITLQGETGKYGPVEHELNVPEETLKDLEKQVKEHLKDIAFSKTLAGKLARDLAEASENDPLAWERLSKTTQRGFLHRAAKLIDEQGWTNPVLTAESVRRELNELAEDAAAEPRDGYADAMARRLAVALSQVVADDPLPWERLSYVAQRGHRHRAEQLVADGWNDRREGYAPPRERRFDLLVDGKLVTSYTEPRVDRDAEGFPLPGSETGRRLNDKEIEAIRTLHDAAQHALGHVALSPVRAHNTEQAIEILERFKP